MRIGLCHKRLDLKGGTERDLYVTASGLRDLGHEVHLFCSEYEIAPPAGVLVHRIPVLPLGRTARLWSFAANAPRVMGRYRCDLVISFGRMPYQDVLRCGGGSHRVFLSKMAEHGGKLRHLWHSVSLYHQTLLMLEKQQFKPGHFKLILAVSDEVKRELMATYAVAENQIVVLYNGVDQNRFHPELRTEWRDAIRCQWAIPLDAPVVLFVGSGFHRKGLDRLLAVWGRAALRDCYLIVAGQDARMNRFRAMADRAAKGRIIFTGRQNGIEKYYGAADVVALPAIQEAFGNVVLEALASGVPVISTHGVGAAEVLAGSIAGEIVQRPDDAREMEARLIALLRRSREPATRMAARRLGERYSWENHFRILEQYLLKVYHQGGSGLSC